MPVSATPTAGDEMSYTFKIDGVNVAKIYGEADGSGGVQNMGIVNDYPYYGKEITTPTAIAGHGAVYTKTDNHLYFQDGVGVEHEVGVADANFGEMYLYANTTATVINTADVFHAVSLTEMTVGVEDGWTYADGVSGADITAYTTYDSGASTLVTMTAVHNLSAGDFITITGTTNYNEAYEVLSAPATTTIEIDKAWDTNNDATGSYNRGSTLTAGVGTAGLYKITWGASITPETNAHIFTGSYMINKTPCTKCRARAKLGIAGDYATIGASSLLEVAEGDKITFIIKNVGATGNITLRHGDLNLHRL